MPGNCRAVKTLCLIWHQTNSGLFEPFGGFTSTQMAGEHLLFGRPTVAKLLLLQPQVKLSLDIETSSL